MNFTGVLSSCSGFCTCGLNSALPISDQSEVEENKFSAPEVKDENVFLQTPQFSWRDPEIVKQHDGQQMEDRQSDAFLQEEGSACIQIKVEEVPDSRAPEDRTGSKMSKVSRNSLGHLMPLHRKHSSFGISDYKTELQSAQAAPLPEISRSTGTPFPPVEGAKKRCCCPCFSWYLATTPTEESAHNQLSKLASITMDEQNPSHQEAMQEYWELMMGDVPFEARSKRWSDDLGFQGSNPWNDFRGGGLLSLRCLLYLAGKYNSKARLLMEEAKYPSRAWYPFSAAGISICQLLAVHLRLHARPMLGPVRTLPAAHPLAMKRFLAELVKEDPVEVFASYWLAAVCKLHKEWRELCARDPDANSSCSFNRVYEYVGVAVESALATTSQDRLKVLAEVNARSTVVSGHNLLVRAESKVLVGMVKMERFFLCLGYRPGSVTDELEEDKHISGFSTESPTEDVSMAVPELIHSAEVYQLYRGACGKEGDLIAERCRLWVDFPNLRIAIAEYDQPASPRNCIPLLDISWCHCEDAAEPDAEEPVYRLDVYSLPSGSCGQQRPSPGQTPRIRVSGSSSSLRDFGLALQKLLKSRDEEGRGRLYFIQKRLFQYLWRSVQLSVSEDRLVEAQAVLAFNLNPKDGIAYVKRKLHKSTEDEIGEWLSQVCTEKGGLDPTMLGDYFSRRDTLPIFWSFVRRIEFSKMDIVGALRQLFDTFKPGGEGQVITRILEHFAESYFQQWQADPSAVEPTTAYKNADTVFQVAVSLIMLNTGLHVAAKKLGNKAKGASMSLEEYIANTRRLVSAEEVPDEALRAWFEDISCTEISVEPMPRTPFSKLPVQPNMEGWLVAVVNNTSLRFWAVLVLQRIYLFSDSQGDVDPADVIDLKDVSVAALEDDEAARKRYLENLPGARRSWRSLCCRRRARPDPWLVAAARRSLEISQRSSGPPVILQKSSKRIPRALRRVVLVAESNDLAEKWVHMISCGP